MYKTIKEILIIVVSMVFISGGVLAGIDQWQATLAKVQPTYTIKEVPVVECAGRIGEDDGCAKHSIKTITIEEGLPPKEKEEVFTHELGHVLFDIDPIAQDIFTRAEDLIPSNWPMRTRTWKENASRHMENWMAGKAEDTEAYRYITYIVTLKLLTQ